MLGWDTGFKMKFSENPKTFRILPKKIRKIRKYFGFPQNISENPKYFRISPNISDFPKIHSQTVGKVSVTSEVDSESLNTLRKNIFKRGSCKFLVS